MVWSVGKTLVFLTHQSFKIAQDVFQVKLLCSRVEIFLQYPIQSYQISVYDIHVVRVFVETHPQDKYLSNQLGHSYEIFPTFTNLSRPANQGASLGRINSKISLAHLSFHTLTKSKVHFRWIYVKLQSCYKFEIARSLGASKGRKNDDLCSKAGKLK